MTFDDRFLDDHLGRRGTDSGLLLLRLGLAVVFIAHSLYLKLMVFTLPGTAAFFESLGLPGFGAYLVFGAEALGGVLIALGLFTRLSAIVLAAVSAGAFWAHVGAGWLFSNAGGGWEYPAFLFLTSTVLLMTGPGGWTVRRLFRERTDLPAAVAA